MTTTLRVPGFERALLLAALTAVAGLAWWGLWQGAGMGMPASSMTAAVLFPHRQPEGAAMVVAWPVVAAMWTVMMVAMMTPSAVPLILLYQRVVTHHTGSASRARLPVAALLLGYLSCWLTFSLLATALQELLQPAGLLSDAMWWSRSAWFSAALLLLAGVYQWSPWKQRCLKRCRDPLRFLTHHGGADLRSAWTLGALHGAYCVGCCGLLMLLLFVGGVMNLAWIAALSILVLLEKLMPDGARIARATGALLVAWALATLLV